MSCTSRAAAAARAARAARIHMSTRYISSTAFPDVQNLPATVSYLKDWRSVTMFTWSAPSTEARSLRTMCGI
jgi:hypothetical protein